MSGSFFMDFDQETFLLVPPNSGALQVTGSLCPTTIVDFMHINNSSLIIITQTLISGFCNFLKRVNCKQNQSLNQAKHSLLILITYDSIDRIVLLVALKVDSGEKDELYLNYDGTSKIRSICVKYTEKSVIGHPTIILIGSIS